MTTHPKPRNTRQRATIVAMLESTDEFVTAQDIHAQLRAQGDSIGLATVYRTLQNLHATGQVDTIYTPDGEIAYRHCSPHHHHHLICRRCGRVQEVAGDELEQWSKQVAQAHGFTEPEHFVEVYGVCATCTAAGPDAN